MFSRLFHYGKLDVIVSMSLCFSSSLALSASTDHDANTAAIKRDFSSYALQRDAAIQAPLLPPIAPILSRGGELRVTGVDFQEGSVFSPSQLQTVCAPFLGRALHDADLEELRYQLTRLYIDHGYVNSGAMIEGYDAKQQRLRIRLKEGVLRDIRVKTAAGLTPEYVAKRLDLVRGPPFHLPTLQERFLMLLEDPVIESLHGSLLPGMMPGESILETEATGQRPYSLGLTLDNHGPVSLGEVRALVNASLRNPIGWGEIINLGFDGTDGSRHERIDMSLPVTAYDTLIHALFERRSSDLIEKPINLLDIESEQRGWEFGITHPLINRLKQVLTLGMSIGRRSNKTWLLGEPFSFGQEAIQGHSVVVPLRFTQEWMAREIDYVYGARSTISVGMNTLGATQTDGPVDSRFITWIIQQRYAQNWLDKRLQGIIRLDVQWADDRLPTLEQLTMGGADTVRGYRENALIRDQGIFGTLELRYGLLNAEQAAQYGRVDGAIFSDLARGWNRGEAQQMNTLHSVGLGLLWAWRDSLQAALYWGHPLKDPPQHTSGSWQDDGFHLQLRAVY